jgi:hypothetical protein
MRKLATCVWGHGWGQGLGRQGVWILWSQKHRSCLQAHHLWELWRMCDARYKGLGAVVEQQRRARLSTTASSEEEVQHTRLRMGQLAACVWGTWVGAGGTAGNGVFGEM